MLYTPSSLIATTFVSLTSDQTTTSTSYVDLMSVNLTIPLRAKFLCTLTCTASSAVGNFFGTPEINMRLLINGADVQSTKIKIQRAQTAQGTALYYISSQAFDEGTHTFTIQWLSSFAFDGIACYASSNSDSQHCALLIEAVTV